jgi:hypothetical protein
MSAAREIAVCGDFPQVDARWPQIEDDRFEPIFMLDSDDENDVFDALADSWDINDEWDWGAEHKEDDQ